ncbi:hypothetical protein [Streptomyces sp. cg35]|uniref:hypothetical protein n=1 Tax=Streptomyces sp. cg35 TaxID=3421650 RepID=UPI003D1744D8
MTDLLLVVAAVNFVLTTVIVVVLVAHRRKTITAAARPVDPANPPTFATVIRADGDPETCCTCHGQPVQDGERVLHWPLPAQVLCERTYTTTENPR